MSQLELITPDFPPPVEWAEFIHMRKVRKAPMTEHAKGLMLTRLAKICMEHHQDPADVLNQSIMNSWTNIYPVKVEQPALQRYHGAPQLALVDVQRANSEAASRLITGYDDERTFENEA